MESSDVAFSGSIPDLYHRHLGPLLFEPYAEDMARRVAALGAGHILETAAGTGIVTEALLERLPGARIVATDLNQAMLDVAAARIGDRGAAFRQADAMSLPFEDHSFDAIVTQFGVMFFPDRVGAYREARRVLRPGGAFLFNVWDRLDQNPVSDVIQQSVAELFPDTPPSFLRRVPFGYHDTARIESDLREAGFGRIESETVRKRSRIGSASAAATGLCRGSPLAAEIEAHGPDALDRAIENVSAALERLEGPDGIDAPMSAHVFTARV
jgi:ubiquinone/menaquinone biosynthesis C-methylase UbiE